MTAPGLRLDSPAPTRGAAAPWLVALALAGACGAARTEAPITRAPTPPATVGLGDCADPERDGVIGARPALVRSDRDLDGDGADEAVIADRGMCTPEGNCHWNLFARDAARDCHRYLGTVAGVGIQRLSGRGEEGFAGLRSFWQLSGGRMLMQEHRYRLGGYRVTEVLLCRKLEDDQLECADTGAR